MSATSENGLFAVCGSFMILSTTAVSLRFWGRWHQHLPLQFDDWTALLGVVTYLGACALSIEVAVLKEFEYGNSVITPAEAEKNAKPIGQMTIAYDFLLTNTLACAKLSALFFYRRIFGIAGAVEAIIIATMLAVVAWYIVFDFLSAYQCHSHVSAIWDGSFKEYCVLNLAWANGLAISDFIFDLWILLLPIYWIVRLPITLPQKLSIIGVFLLAFVGIGASIARIVVFFNAASPGRQTLYIGVLEGGVTITVINLPAIWYTCTSTNPNKAMRSLQTIRKLFNKSRAGSPPEKLSSNKSSDGMIGTTDTENDLRQEKSQELQNLQSRHYNYPDLEKGSP